MRVACLVWFGDQRLLQFGLENWKKKIHYLFNFLLFIHLIKHTIQHELPYFFEIYNVFYYHLNK